MKVICIAMEALERNGNTVTLLEKAMEGASSQGAETNSFIYIDLNYKGCISCFSLQDEEREKLWQVAVKDDLTPIFEEVLDAQSLIFDHQSIWELQQDR